MRWFSYSDVKANMGRLGCHDDASLLYKTGNFQFSLESYNGNGAIPTFPMQHYATGGINAGKDTIKHDEF
jgi:hypothetical protein